MQKCSNIFTFIVSISPYIIDFIMRKLDVSELISNFNMLALSDNLECEA
jgi:hypothetical protein